MTDILSTYKWIEQRYETAAIKIDNREAYAHHNIITDKYELIIITDTGIVSKGNMSKRQLNEILNLPHKDIFNECS